MIRLNCEDFARESMTGATDSGSVSGILERLRALMFKYAGIYRDEHGLFSTKHFIKDNGRILHMKPKDRYSWEMKNFFVTAKLMVESALLRT